MWKATVDGIEVAECEVEFSNKGQVMLYIGTDSQELYRLKSLPSSGDNTFAVNVEASLVSLSCKSCWLISFKLYETIGYDPTREYPLGVCLTFGFKHKDEDRLKSLISRS